MTPGRNVHFGGLFGISHGGGGLGGTTIDGATTTIVDECVTIFFSFILLLLTDVAGRKDASITDDLIRFDKMDSCSFRNDDDSTL